MLQKVIYLVFFLTVICNTVVAQNKIGAVNIDKLIQKMPEAIEVTKYIKHLEDSLQNQLQILEKEINSYIYAFASDTLCHWYAHRDTTGIYSRRFILDKLTNFQNLPEQNKNYIAKVSTELWLKINDKLKAQIKEVADENDYRYVLKLGSKPKFPLPLCDDITDLVIAKLGL